MSCRLHHKTAVLLSRERGTMIKHGVPGVSVALAYPNTYRVGMSNLGLHRIYSLLNRIPDAVCERAFLPDEEDLPEYYRTGTRIFSVETQRPLADFDVLAFSVSFEQDYVNVLEMLRLAGIAPDKTMRTDNDPLLLLGGVCSFFNPEPLADFFDVVLVGEGEEAVAQIVDCFRADRDKGRRRLLDALAEIPGIYVPEDYEIIYNDDGTIRERKKLRQEAPEIIVKRTAPNIGTDPAATAILTPDTEFSDMYLAEVTRGCGRHCRFCMAGYIYLPPRNLGIEAAKDQAGKAAAASGRMGLVGAALSDYPEISELCGAIEGGLSVSSLRADSLSRSLIVRLAASGHKTISLAPEAGSERLRKAINKGVTEEDILRAAGMVFGSGIPNLKLYFIIGLPGETMEDVEAVVELAKKVREVQLGIARPRGTIGRITLSVNSFVPKPFTPFQWEPMEPVVSLNRKLRFLEKEVRVIGNMNIIHDLPKWEYFQAALARGDRRTGRLLVAAQQAGGDWKAASREIGMDLDFYVARRRSFDEVFPWDFIDIGVRKDYLKNEYQRSLEEKFTPPCKVGACKVCGVCK